MTETCPVCNGCGCSSGSGTVGAPRGRALVVRSLAAFGAPLALALAGAFLGRQALTTQWAGALAGLVLGAWAAYAGLRMDRRSGNGS